MRIRTHAVVLLAMALIMATAAPAAAHGKEGTVVTRGTFLTLPGGVDLGYEIGGVAVMVRSDDRTVVKVRVSGLDANTTYPTHVHNAACSATPPGGGHYQHEVGGAVDAVNEMWPVVTTDDLGRGRGFAIHDHRARPDAMAIVIHYPPDTSIRLACLDLG